MTGRGLRRIRRRLGLTQVELAKRLGRHQQTISDYERGTPGVPVMVGGGRESRLSPAEFLVAGPSAGYGLERGGD